MEVVAVEGSYCTAEVDALAQACLEHTKQRKLNGKAELMPRGDYVSLRQNSGAALCEVSQIAKHYVNSNGRGISSLNFIFFYPE
jgi:hypothetical protein